MNSCFATKRQMPNPIMDKRDSQMSARSRGIDELNRLERSQLLITYIY